MNENRIFKPLVKETIHQKKFFFSANINCMIGLGKYEQYIHSDTSNNSRNKVQNDRGYKQL